jgi:DNA-binding PadR family transcriptional regulator
VRALRTEQEGELPARSVYEITAEGRSELHVFQTEAFEEVQFRP